MKAPLPACDSNSLAAAYRKSAALYRERPAFVFADRACSYTGLLRRSDIIAAGLIEQCGVRPGEHVALIADNCAEWLAISLGVQGAAAVELPQDPGMSHDELVHFLADDQAAVAVVGTTLLAMALWARRQGCPGLRQIVVIEPGISGTVLRLADIESAGRRRLRQESRLPVERQAGVKPDDRAAIIRTSGTTAAPKAVLLSHRNLLHSQCHLPAVVDLGPRDRVLLSLPLWHLYGRLAAFVALASGACIHFGKPEDLVRDLRKVRPSFFPSFPLVWEQIHHGLSERIEAMPGAGILFRAFLSTSRLWLQWRDLLRSQDLREQARSPARNRAVRGAAACGVAALALPHAIAQLLFKLTLHRALGGRLRAAIIGDAPLPYSVDEGLRAMGFSVLEGYGSTEQIVSCVRKPGHNTPGTVGQALPDVEIRLLDDALARVRAGSIGQIAVAGPQVCLGYYNNESLNSTAFIERDGRRFHLTGDLGRFDANGHLVFVGRTKNVLRGAAGERVYPEWSENWIHNSPYVEQAVLHPRAGLGPGVLIVPDFEHLCRRHGVPDALAGINLPEGILAWRMLVAAHEEIFADWVRSKPVQDFYREELRRVLTGSHLPAAQLPSTFRVLGRPLRVGIELTHTLKLRRDVIHGQLCPTLDEAPIPAFAA